MAGPERKPKARRSRLPIMLPPPEPRLSTPRIAGFAGRRPEEDSIFTLRGYKAWAARVKATWDAES